jgi:pilus assembly protein CpaE
MARSFDYVVIDCQVSYDEELLAVLDRSDVIFLVLHPELGALRNAKHFLQLAETLGYPRSKIAVVINRANSNVGITPQEVERVLGPGQYFRLNSYGRQLTSALNLGRPVVLANPKAEFSQMMHKLAEYVERAGNDTRG